jgi:hypothetical protein
MDMDIGALPLLVGDIESDIEEILAAYDDWSDATTGFARTNATVSLLFLLLFMQCGAEVGVPRRDQGVSRCQHNDYICTTRRGT